MRDIALWRDNGASQEWDDLPEQIRESLENIIHCRDIIKTTVACQSILIGKEVHMISVYSDHGTAVALIERHTGLKKSQCYNFRQVYLQFGQEYLNGGVENSRRLEFSDSVLVALAQAPDPQAALAEATERKEAGENVTYNMAKEIAAAQKRAEEAEQKVEAVQLKLVEAERRADAAEAQTKPDQSRLIKELALRRKGGGISEAEAQAYSLLPEYLQRAILETLRKNDQAAIDRQKAERTAAEAVANQQEAVTDAIKARAEAEEAKRRADEIAREGAQAVIDDLNAQIDALNKQVARERETAWEEGKRAGIAQKDEAAAKAAADLVEKVAALEREKATLSRKLSAADGKLEAAWREARMEEARANGLQEQMEAAHPVAKDNIHAGVVAHMTEDLKAEIAKLEADCETFQRKLTNAALETLAAVVNGYLRGQQEMLIEG